MKYFAIIFAICVASSLAATPTGVELARLKEYDATCIVESGVCPDVVVRARNGNPEWNHPKLSCYFSCFMKKSGFMNAEGAFDEEGFRAQITDNLSAEKIDDIVNKCRFITGANECETASKLLKCYVDNKNTPIAPKARRCSHCPH